jgi:hypothetical protein
LLKNLSVNNYLAVAMVAFLRQLLDASLSVSKFIHALQYFFGF